MSSLNVYHQNVRGLRSKTDVFFRNLRSCDYDVVTLTETWLCEGILDDELFDSRYCVWRRDRDYTATKQTRGGGVAIAVKRSLITSRKFEWQSTAEDIWISIVLRDPRSRTPVKLNICCLYLCSENLGHSFSDQLINFCDNIETVISSNFQDKFIILGDFNMSFIDWLDTDEGLVPVNASGDSAAHFIETFNFCNLEQYNSVINAQGRILDLVFASETISVAPCLDPLVPEDPYHKALCINVPFTESASLPLTNHIVFLYNRGDYNSIKDDLVAADWTDLLCRGSLDEAVQCFYRIVYNLRTKHIPQRVKRGDNNYPLWYNRPLIKAIKEKFKYFRRFKTYGNLSDKHTFDLLRERVKRLERLCYMKYINLTEDSIKANPKYFWKFIKNNLNKSSYPVSMTYLGTTSTSGDDISNLFNEYFLSNFLERDPTSCTQFEEPSEPVVADLASIVIETNEIIKLLNNLDLTKSAGPDELPAVFLVKCADSLSLPLSLIFKRSIAEGVVPAIWKSAFITPIHKKGQKNRVDNYRPISKLCLIAKIFERIVYNQVYAALKSSFCPQQHGFLKKRSTDSNLLLFNDFITQQLDNGDQVDAIYTDYSKAFDRIDHILLLKKLLAIGIRGDLFRWFSSYVENRSQAVVLNGYKSNWTNIPSGVPQGSLLAPLLFIIFVFDISNCFKNSQFLLFADDMKIFRTVNDAIDSALLQDDLLQFDIYCLNNKLDLNVSKCFTVSFTRKRNVFNNNYSLKNKPLLTLHEIRDLGVIMDSKLIFDTHINSITSKAYKALGFIIRSCKNLRRLKSVKVIYCAFVRSHLEYASQVWNPSYKVYINKLESIQKKFIRHIKFKFKLPRLPYNQLCIKLHLLPLHVRRYITDITYLMKIAQSLVDCPALLAKLHLLVPSRSQSRRRLSLFVPWARTNFRQNSYFIRAIRSFNDLCIENEDIDLFASSISVIRKVLTSKFCDSVEASLPI